MRRLKLIPLLPALLIVMALPMLIQAHEVDDDTAHNSMCHSPHLGSPSNGWWCDTPAKWEAAYWAHEALKSAPAPRRQSSSWQPQSRQSRSKTQTRSQSATQPQSTAQPQTTPISIPPPPEHRDCSISCLYTLP